MPSTCSICGFSAANAGLITRHRFQQHPKIARKQLRQAIAHRQANKKAVVPVVHLRKPKRERHDLTVSQVLAALITKRDAINEVIEDIKRLQQYA